MLNFDAHTKLIFQPDVAIDLKIMMKQTELKIDAEIADIQFGFCKETATWKVIFALSMIFE